MTVRPRALVVSPTPTHPPDHGNRRRVHQMTAALAERGMAIDFVLYPMDDDWQGAVPPALAAMQSAWDSVVVVAPSRPLHARPAALDHTIDEWWDEALERQVAWLAARRRYAIMLVHYAFLSRALTLAPPGCVRVLDTHDRLAGRRALFERHGETPEFFHTTPDEERRALARADIVVAIKASEAAAFAGETDAVLVTIPFLPPRAPPPPPRLRGERLQVGFIGADNRVNAANLRCFLTRLERHRRLFLPELDVVVAGRVGRHVTPSPGLRVLGPVADVGRFYGAVAVVVAPLAFSTGLKIKVAEALARGIPVVATEDAFDGFAAEDRLHALPDIDAVCMGLIELAADRDRLAALRAGTRRTAERARAAVEAGFACLDGAIAAHRHCIVVVTDVAWWRRGCLLEERLSQTTEFLAAAAPLLVLAATALPHEGRPPPGVAVRYVGPLAGAKLARRVAREIAKLAAGQTVLACWQALSSSAVPLVAGALVDCWPRAARHPVADGPDTPGHDLDLDGTRVAALALRYLPPGIEWDAMRGGLRPLLVLVETVADGMNPVRARLVARLQAAGGRRRVAVMRSSDLAYDPALFERLASVGPPVAIVTVEMAALGRELADALGRASGAATFHLAGALYPQLAPDADEARSGGEDRIVTDAMAHAAAIADWLEEARPTAASELSDDAGWSVVWRRLAERARAARDATREAADAHFAGRCERV